ncbi:MAG: type I DNA topoisomerase, partial [Chromatiales bacterium]
QRKRNPAPPFITSTLQQEASRKLGFTAKRTMRIAQQLYEGVDIGQGAVGLITYMRTDSVTLANEAIDDIRDYIRETWGKEMHPEKPRSFKTKSKNAQEAHEAIRPTSIRNVPKEISHALSDEQRKLYELIWKRTIASQMTHATINTVSADLAAGDKGIFRASGSTIAKPGFMSVYLEGEDDAPRGSGDEKLLPPLKEGEEIDLLSIRPEQHFTEPPPRYNEASLVKALEEHGIGRPSTYASIISTLQDREYVTMDKKRFIPTDVGRVVKKFLTNYFTQYVDYDFTAKLEDELDAVSRGEEEWVPLLEKFWQPFRDRVEHTGENVDRSEVTQEPTDEKCPECGKDLVIKLGRNGRFIACTGYPDCNYTRDLGEGGEKQEPEIVQDRKCPKCDSDLLIRNGRYGKFIGCSAYPECKHIEPLEKPVDTGVGCPQCAKGTLMKRKSRRGKIFFSCSTYPKCDYAVWNQPVQEICPKCSWPILTIKTTKSRGTEKVCPQRGCDYSEPVETEEADAVAGE